MNNMQYAGNWKSGSFWLRFLSLFIHIKAPWALVLFSEREGYRRYYPKKGWRIRVEKDKRIKLDA